jgi:hypothetical protein
MRVQDVPPGIVTLTATPLSVGKPSTVAHIRVLAGASSTVFMVPTP